MKYRNFEELPIWQLSREISNYIYKIIDKSDTLKKDFRLTGQLIGSGLSIMNNIAEGFDSDSTKEFIRFLRYSQRSASEIMSMTYVLLDVYKLEKDSKALYTKTLEERKQIKGFIKYLKGFNN